MSYSVKRIDHLKLTTENSNEISKKKMSYSYSQEYIEFINADILEGSEQDFNDWYNLRFDPLKEDEQKYFTDFNGIENIGTKTVYFELNSNRYDETTYNDYQKLANMLANTGLNISLEEPSSNDYTIIFKDILEHNGGHALIEATSDKSEWKTSEVRMDFDKENGFSTLLHEALHALGHGHDGKYNGNDYLVNNSQIVGDVEGVNLVANTSYATEEIEKTFSAPILNCCGTMWVP